MWFALKPIGSEQYLPVRRDIRSRRAIRAICHSDRVLFPGLQIMAYKLRCPFSFFSYFLDRNQPFAVRRFDGIGVRAADDLYRLRPGFKFPYSGVFAGRTINPGASDPCRLDEGAGIVVPL